MEIIGIVVVVAYTYEAAKANRINKQIAKAARDSANAAVAASRSWIVPDGFIADGTQITFKWRNAGNTPAINVLVTEEYSSTAIHKLTGCEPLKKKGLSESFPLVLRNEDFSNRLLNLPREWIRPAGIPGSPEIRAVLNVHGCVWYTDVVTNKENSTEFCFIGSQFRYLPNTPTTIRFFTCNIINRQDRPFRNAIVFH